MIVLTNAEKRMRIGDTFTDIRYGSSQARGVIPIAAGLQHGITQFIDSSTAKFYETKDCVWLEFSRTWTLKEWHDEVHALKDMRRVYWFDIYNEQKQRVYMFPKLSHDINSVTGTRKDIDCPWRKLAAEFGYFRTYPNKVGKRDRAGIRESSLEEDREEAAKIRRLLVPYGRKADVANGLWKPDTGLVTDGEGI